MKNRSPANNNYAEGTQAKFWPNLLRILRRGWGGSRSPPNPPCLGPCSARKGAYWRCTCPVLLDDPTDGDSDIRNPSCCARLLCNRVYVWLRRGSVAGLLFTTRQPRGGGGPGSTHPPRWWSEVRTHRAPCTVPCHVHTHTHTHAHTRTPRAHQTRITHTRARARARAHAHAHADTHTHTHTRQEPRNKNGPRKVVKQHV